MLPLQGSVVSTFLLFNCILTDKVAYMRRHLSILFVDFRCLGPFLSIALLIGCSGCGRSNDQAAARQTPLRVLCGSSMAEPIQEIVRQYEPRPGAVLVDLGGSETLLPRILAGAPADIYVCHDPFEEKIRQAGKLSASVEMGQLRPVLLVRAGNPQQVRRLEDLARPGLKLGIGDPRYSTCGEMFVDLLRKKGLYEPVMTNVVLQARTHAELGNGLVLGALDAAVVWNFVARLYEGKVELVKTEAEYPLVRVTVLGLSSSANPAARDAFLQYCRTAPARAIFGKHGYGAGAR